MAISHKRDERCRPSSQRPQHPTLYRRLKRRSQRGWGAHLEQNSAKGLWSDKEKRLHINVVELKAVSLALRSFKVIQKIRQCHCLIIVIAPGPGMPWFWDLVQLSTEIPLQLPVSRTLLKQSHKYVFHSNPQHLNLHAWC